jgi:hypothetical protein
MENREEAPDAEDEHENRRDHACGELAQSGIEDAADAYEDEQ